jgi:hypothetical protein
MRLLFRQRGDGPVKPVWEYFQSEDLFETIDKAKELGWAEKKVQVRANRVPMSAIVMYAIEPYEEDCGCSNILKYEDYSPIRSQGDGYSIDDRLHQGQVEE